MERDDLLRELRDLHRGRGVRRPDVGDWLGPELAGIIHLTPHTSDEDARTALVVLLTRLLRPFPQDLALLFRTASGIAEDAPFLEDRLRGLESPLQRGPRALRRRLRQAEQLLADALLQEFGTRVDPNEARGWQWVTQDMELTLGTDAVVDFRRTLQALDDHQKYFSEEFFIPAVEPHDDVQVEAVKGVTLLAVDDSVRGRWHLTLEMPRALRRGQELDTHVRVRLSRARALQPFLAIAPARTTRSTGVTIHFGTPPQARRVWIIDAVFPVAVTLDDPSRQYLDLTDTSDVSVSFSNPHLGLAYGVGWEWID